MFLLIFQLFLLIFLAILTSILALFLNFSAFEKKDFASKKKNYPLRTARGLDLQAAGKNIPGYTSAVSSATFFVNLEIICKYQAHLFFVWLLHWFGWFPGPRSLKTRAQYKSNNHLTGGSANTVKKRGSDAKLGFLGKPGFCPCCKPTDTSMAIPQQRTERYSSSQIEGYTVGIIYAKHSTPHTQPAAGNSTTPHASAAAGYVFGVMLFPVTCYVCGEFGSAF